MAHTPAPKTQGLGFLTILHDNHGYVGGYLVTNLWSRPIEFRLSSAVQPNRIQQILYGGTLQSYISADLIGKTLVEKTTAAAQYIFTDWEPALDLRLHLDIPIVFLPGDGVQSEAAKASSAMPLEQGSARLKTPLRCHASFPGDAAAFRELLDHLDGRLDLTEPFVRIREAMSEARKLGATNRN